MATILAQKTRAGEALETVIAEARACRLCAAQLPPGPRPVLRGRANPRALVVGQAPGTKVHETGVPWNDASGRRPGRGRATGGRARTPR